MKCALPLSLALLLGLSLAGHAQTSSDPAIQKKIDELKSLPMTGALYHSVLLSLGVQPPAYRAIQPSTDQNDAFVQPAIGQSGPYEVTNDVNQDTEPVITTVQLSGTRYFTTAYHTYTGSGSSQTIRINTARTTDGFTTFQFAQPSLFDSSYHWSFDSNIIANTGGGIAPGRLYLVGISESKYVGGPIGVFVWSSDNAGLSWRTPVRIDYVVNDPSTLLDNPHIAVNPNNGHVYVVYTRLTLGSPDQTKIYLSRSTDGGQSFSQTPLEVLHGTVGGPQAAVNTTNNYTYLVWADYALNAIRVATSTDDGQTFPEWNWHSEGARNALVGPCGSGCSPVLRTSTNPPGNAVRTWTLPIARYNQAAHVLGVVWHEREQGNVGNPVITDASYAYYDDTILWQPAVPLMLNRHVPGVDNFQPSLDSDVNGNVCSSGMTRLPPRPASPISINPRGSTRRTAAASSAAAISSA
jgi:hypothetical protein